jgi:hypothetical protein
MISLEKIIQDFEGRLAKLERGKRMKVEHIASPSGPSFYKRIVRFLANEKMDVIDIKYSTTALKTLNEDDEPVQYSALILYEDKQEDDKGTTVSDEFVRQHEFLLVFYNIVWNQNWVSTDKVWEWTKEAEKSSGYDKNGEIVN